MGALYICHYNAVCTYHLNINHIELFIYLNKSLYYISFFFVGYFLKGTNFLIENPEKQNRNMILGFVVLLFLL